MHQRTLQKLKARRPLHVRVMDVITPGCDRIDTAGGSMSSAGSDGTHGGVATVVSGIGYATCRLCNVGQQFGLVAVAIVGHR